MKNRRGAAEKIAQKHGIENVDGLERVIAWAEHSYRQGLAMAAIEKRDGELARLAKKLVGPARELKKRFRRMPEEYRGPFEWQYPEEPKTRTRTDSLDARLASWSRPLFETPDKSQRSLERDLERMVEIFETMAEMTAMRGRTPDYATFSALSDLRQYWKNDLGRKSRSNKFIGFVEDVVALFGKPKRIRGMVEIIRRDPDIEF